MFLQKLPANLFTEISKRGDFPDLAACQDATIQMARTLATAEKMQQLHVTDSGSSKKKPSNGKTGKRKSADATTTDGEPPYPCKTCGEMHFHSDCPVRKLAKKNGTGNGVKPGANKGNNGKKGSNGKFVKKDKGGKDAAAKEKTPAAGSKQEAWQKGLCFICHQAGHLASECPKKDD
jgi:ribosomal protein L32